MTKPGDPVWNSSGCVATVNAFTVTCTCDHMTSFGVLTAGSASSGAGGISSEQADAISYLSYIGVCISMACFIIMLALYGYFSGARQERNKKIFVHILITLFFTMLLYLVGALVGPSKLTSGGCKTVAVLLQYSVLAAFAWMFAEGHLLLSGIRNPFAAAGKKSIKQYLVLSYGAPAVYVGVIAGVYWSEYGEQSSGVCYVSDRILPSVYVPIAAVGVANLHVFYRVWEAIAAVPKSRRRSPLQSWRKRVQVRLSYVHCDR